MTKLLTADLSHRSDRLIYSIDDDTTAIATPLCLVSFENGGCGYSFPIPTDFDPQRIIEQEDPIMSLFNESYLLTKILMLTSEKRLSLHAILCKIYGCNENVFLSNGKIFPCSQSNIKNP